MLVVACAVLIAAASQCGAAAAAPVREQRLCSLRRCTTLVASSNIRVFRATAKRPDRESYESTFAEWLPSRRVTALASDETTFGESSVQGSPAVSGRFVAYAIITVPGRGPGTGFGEDVARLDVQTGDREWSPADGAGGSGFVSGLPGVTDVVVTPAGSVAWVIEGGAPFVGGEESRGSKAILVLPAGATSSRLLSYSPTIEPKSLAAIPGHIYWLEAGVAHTFGAP